MGITTPTAHHLPTCPDSPYKMQPIPAIIVHRLTDSDQIYSEVTQSLHGNYSPQMVTWVGRMFAFTTAVSSPTSAPVLFDSQVRIYKLKMNVQETETISSVEMYMGMICPVTLRSHHSISGGGGWRFVIKNLFMSALINAQNLEHLFFFFLDVVYVYI